MKTLLTLTLLIFTGQVYASELPNNSVATCSGVEGRFPPPYKYNPAPVTQVMYSDGVLYVLGKSNFVQKYYGLDQDGNPIIRSKELGIDPAIENSGIFLGNSSYIVSNVENHRKYSTFTIVSENSGIAGEYTCKTFVLSVSPESPGYKLMTGEIVEGSLAGYSAFAF